MIMFSKNKNKNKNKMPSFGLAEGEKMDRDEKKENSGIIW
jgi:hypothetical protein